MLNWRDKEQLVIELHKQGKTIREIASAAHLSFTDIGAIIRKLDRLDNEDGAEANKDIKNKSKDTQVLFYLKGKNLLR